MSYSSWEARFRSLIRLLILALCALIRAARPDASDGAEGSLAMRSAFPMMRVSGVRMSWDMPAIQFARASFCLAMRSDARVTLSERFASVPFGRECVALPVPSASMASSMGSNPDRVRLFESQ